MYRSISAKSRWRKARRNRTRLSGAYRATHRRGFSGGTSPQPIESPGGRCLAFSPARPSEISTMEAEEVPPHAVRSSAPRAVPDRHRSGEGHRCAPGAYDDSQGVTAAFNLNLLTRINRELGANFDVAAFAHRAVWNAEKSRVEMHLVSERAQSVIVRGRCFDFAAGETIHTENSRKYTLKQFAAIACRAGWSLERSWSSTDPSFGMVLLR